MLLRAALEWAKIACSDSVLRFREHVKLCEKAVAEEEEALFVLTRDKFAAYIINGLKKSVRKWNLADEQTICDFASILLDELTTNDSANELTIDINGSVRLKRHAISLRQKLKSSDGKEYFQICIRKSVKDALDKEFGDIAKFEDVEGKRIIAECEAALERQFSFEPMTPNCANCKHAETSDDLKFIWCFRRLMFRNPSEPTCSPYEQSKTKEQ